nr:D-3-phosphoglycerate dehydrogenase 2, chloroplastic [Ipomoea batatas]
MYRSTASDSLLTAVKSSLRKRTSLFSSNSVTSGGSWRVVEDNFSHHHQQQQRDCSSAGAGILGKILKMGENGSSHITRVLFCGPNFPAAQNYTREYVKDYPFIQVDDIPFDNVPAVIKDYDICVVKNLRLNSDLISSAKRMKLIMQFGVGLEGVDISAATTHGIKVARIPSGATGNATSCAEMAIYLILGLLRKQHEMDIAIKQKKLGEPIGDTLLGKTVFILGYGNIGIHLAKRLRPFDVRILATKRSWPSHLHNSSETDAPHMENNGGCDLVDEKGSHDDILKFASKADIVVCCLAMNSETAGIVNNDFLSSMRKGAILINIARGGLLDYDAVFNHLKCGHLGGLGIDVAWTEPFDPNNAILNFRNVIITPHVAGVTEHSYRYMAKVVGDVALQLHAGTSFTGIEIVN